MRADGGGPIEPLDDPKYEQFPGSWSSDGRLLAFVIADPLTSFDIYLLRMEDGQITPFIKTKFSEGWPEISPDGHWLTYSSNESGRYEVYVTSFTEKDPKILISNEGGCEPLWARNGRELFYWDVERKKLMVVDIST
jgi:Tol biopolymer transport system component